MIRIRKNNELYDTFNGEKADLRTLITPAQIDQCNEESPMPLDPHYSIENFKADAKAIDVYNLPRKITSKTKQWIEDCLNS